MGNPNPYNPTLWSIYRNIQYYRQMIALSRCLCQRRFYENLLYNEMARLNCWQMYNLQQINSHKKATRESTAPSQRKFTSAELAQYNGSGGKPAYVAVNGIVYDVSLESTWGGGTHFSLYAGQDLTGEFGRCHSGNIETLRNLPQVGILAG